MADICASVHFCYLNHLLAAYGCIPDCYCTVTVRFRPGTSRHDMLVALKISIWITHTFVINKSMKAKPQSGKWPLWGMWNFEDLNQSEPISIEAHRRSSTIWRVPRHASDARVRLQFGCCDYAMRLLVKAMQPSLCPTFQTRNISQESTTRVMRTRSRQHVEGRKEGRMDRNEGKIILDGTWWNNVQFLFHHFHCKGSFRHQEQVLQTKTYARSVLLEL